MDLALKARRESPAVLFLGKRFYTNRDALKDAYGRIYQLPYHWAQDGVDLDLWLIDYHSREAITRQDGKLAIVSSPLFAMATLIRLFRLLLVNQRYTHVVASGDCYLGLLGFAIAKRHGASFIFDVYDKYDEFPGYPNLRGLDIFRFLLKSANNLLFASQALLKQFGRPANNDFVVPNGLDTEKFKPRDIALCRRELALPQGMIFIGYFGGMEPDRGVQDLIDAVLQLRREGVGIELLIGGNPVPSISLDAPGIRYLGIVPYEKMPRMLGACNLLAVPYRRSAFMDCGSSNKIAESLACSRPLVATRTPNLVENFPETAQLLKKRLAEPANPASLADVIRLQLSSPITCSLQPGWDWPSVAESAARQLYLSHISFTGS